MKSRWSIFVLGIILTLAFSPLTTSLVTGAQSRVADDDDEDALDDPLPDYVDLRVFIHRPRVLKPNHLGVCVASTNSDVNHFETSPWHLSGPMTWSLNRATVPSSVSSSIDSILNQSFDAWYSGVFRQGSDTRVKRAKLDHVNAILWKKMGRSTLGSTFVWFSTLSGEVLEVDTVFNKKLRWANFPNSPDCQTSIDAYDLQNIATHEFGHWIGLDDLFDDADKDLTMYGFGAGGEVKKRTLGTGDISGKNALEP
jgi:hypothetical protein